MAVCRKVMIVTLLLTVACRSGLVEAGTLQLELVGGDQVTAVGALNRWDRDGNPRLPVDARAKIDRPAWSATAKQQHATRWVFNDLEAGRYDLVLLLRDRVRIEGFHYPPVLEFDPVMLHGGEIDPEVRSGIVAAVDQSPHYENRVTPLFMTGQDDCVRVLVELLRDQPTSYDAEYGQPIATLRHEIWQFTHRYGAWTKEKRTRVLDRVLLGKSELRSWTWVWTPQLGGIEMETSGKRMVRFEIPREFPAANCRGWVGH